ncbi:MAG: hypothetical protein IT159_14145 [Bryobacterales bacterium]|nr:hypothetical protein [Bryobacterales bacterium]
MSSQSHVLLHAPVELTRGTLRRLGEGAGKVIYASEHWVVKRERSAADILALIVIWKVLSRVARALPARLGEPLLRHPSRWIGLLRVVVRAFVLVIPRSLWMMTHAGEMWRVYHARDVRGERLAQTHLAGTPLVPERVTFPPVRVRVGGWPGWLTVSEAVERVEDTLYHRLVELAAQNRYEQVETWLERFLALRQAGWQRGLFSVDAHLKNFGVAGDRVVLLDPGGLTDHWPEIEQRLSSQAGSRLPHEQLGLGPVLLARQDIAERFNARWREIVSHAGVRRQWPGGIAGRHEPPAGE